MTPDLVGLRVPGGACRLEGYENWLLCDAVRAPRTERAHPIWSFFAPQRGMGLTLGALFDELGAPLAEGSVLGSFGARWHAALEFDVEHVVAGGVTDVHRRASRVLGPFDDVTMVLELARADGTPVLTATYGFLLPRPGADVPAPSGTSGPSGRAPTRAGPEVVGAPVDVRAEEMKLIALLLRDPNPIHLDPDAAAACGYGRACVNQGPANLAYALTHAEAVHGPVGGFTARFHRMVRDGDVVTPVVGADGSDDPWFVLRGADGAPAVSGSISL